MSHYSKNSPTNGTWIIVGLVAVMLLAVVALIIFSPPSAQNQKGIISNSALTAPEMAYDFGTVSMAKGKVTKLFTINNNTSDVITMRKLYTSCMCTSATLIQGERRVGPFSMEGHSGPIPTINEKLAASQTAQIEVTFDPAAHGPAGIGPVVRNILLETNDGKRLALEIKAQVVL